MKRFIVAALSAVGSLGVSAAHAAQDASTAAINGGFYEIGQDLQTLLQGSGGFLIIIGSLLFAGVMLAMGKGWGPAVTAFGLALFLGYGTTALTSLSGVTADFDMIELSALDLEPTAPSMQIVVE